MFQMDAAYVIDDWFGGSGTAGLPSATATDPGLGVGGETTDVDTKPGGNSDWFGDVFKQLTQTGVSAASTALNSWITDSLSGTAKESSERQAYTSGEPAQASTGLFGGLTATTGTGLLMVAGGVAGLVGLVFALRK